MDEGRLLDIAARAALRGMGRVEPNPMVGCVIADPTGRVLGIGHHRRFGGAHAEVEAVSACRKAGFSPKGSTVLCTLEPCGHTGKTGPCADLLLESGVARVVCARREPTSLAGGGAERLRAGGVDVAFSCASAPARYAGAAHAKRAEEGLAWVVAKWAQTVDGCVATRGGESQWISGGASRRRVHAMRGRVDAIVVGVGTVLADDPTLTARGVPVRRVARRVVLDSGLATPPESKLVGGAREIPVTIFADEDVVARGGERVERLRARGVEVVGVGVRDGRVDARAALAALVERHDASRVLVEAGPRVLGSLMRDGLIDEAHVFVGPLVMGDEGARRAAVGHVAEGLSDARRLELWRVRRLGGDAWLTYGRADQKV